MSIRPVFAGIVVFVILIGINGGLFGHSAYANEPQASLDKKMAEQEAMAMAMLSQTYNGYGGTNLHYAGLNYSQTTDENGIDRQAMIEKTWANSEIVAEQIVSQIASINGPYYVGLDNVQTTNENTYDRQAAILQAETDTATRAIMIANLSQEPSFTKIASPKYPGIDYTVTTTEGGYDRNIAVENGRASAIAYALAIFGTRYPVALNDLNAPTYVGLDNSQTTTGYGFDRQAAITAGMEQGSQKAITVFQVRYPMDTIGQYPHYTGLDNTITTDENGKDRQALIEKAWSDSEQLAQQYAGISVNKFHQSS